MINPMELKERHYLVTGASSGLGRQTSIMLSRLGATVSLVARNEEKLRETAGMMEGGGNYVYPFDVTHVEEIEELVKEIVRQGGKLDGFVHCAGIATVKPLSMTKHDFMQEMMGIHVLSFVEFVRSMSKKKLSNDGGSIVAVSSAGAKRGDKGKVAYTIVKGALDAAVRSLAVELGERQKIRVNTVNPGWIKTDMYYEFIREFGQERMDETLRGYVLGVADPSEVANVIAFLLSDASSKITGQNIFVDSGWTIAG